MVRNSRLLLVLFAFLLAVWARPAPAQLHVSAAQRIASLSLPAVVSIRAGFAGKIYWPPSRKVYDVSVYREGSGFFVTSAGHIATSSQVFALSQLGEETGRQLLFARFLQALVQDVHGKLDVLLRSTADVQRIHQEAQFIEAKIVRLVLVADGSEFPFIIEKSGEAGPGGAASPGIVKIDVHNAPVLHVGDADRVQILDPVLVIGYSASDTGHGKAEIPGNLAATIEGKVSARKQVNEAHGLFQLVAVVDRGMSGGPMLNANGDVVGLINYRTDAAAPESDRFVFAASSPSLLSLLNELKLVNGGSSTDKAYQQGLEAYWRGELIAAKAGFSEAIRLFPQHSESRRLLSECETKLAAAAKTP